MPKFGCKCGCVMNLSTGWESYELALIPEKNIEEISCLLESNEALDVDGFFERIDKDRVGVLRCPQCERLWLETESGVYQSYVKEVESR